MNDSTLSMTSVRRFPSQNGNLSSSRDQIVGVDCSAAVRVWELQCGWIIEL
jgi:hypothetical protein